MTTAAESRPRKPKKCRTCATPFQPRSMTHVCCSIKCSVEFARSKREKVERKQLAADKAKAKTRGQWQAEAQRAFNAYIRARDEDLPCISCGRWHNGKWNAGHYLSVGARPNLRFDELNVHRQCETCNTYLHGNLVNYRRALIAKIGIDAVEGLESDQSIKKYSIQDLQKIKQTYIAKRKVLEISK